MEKPYDYIARMYDWLTDGESSRGSCEQGCYRVDIDGGHPSGCDLNVKREGGRLLFNCFSASCPCSGSVRTGRDPKGHGSCGGTGGCKKRAGASVDGLAEANRVLKRCVRHLTPSCIDYLERNSISRGYAEDSGVLWDSIQEQIAIPVSNFGKDKGVLVRPLGERDSSGSKGKWYNLVEEGTVFFKQGEGDTLYIVEAPTSVLALNEHLNVNCLTALSINISDEKIVVIKKVLQELGCKKIVLLPDPDVSRDKALKLKKALTRRVAPTNVKRLNAKPRYAIGEIL